MDPEAQIKIRELESQLADLKESLFLCQQDEERYRVEHIALKNFIQNLFESCKAVNTEELDLEQVLGNLQENIRVFARDHQIRL